MSLEGKVYYQRSVLATLAKGKVFFCKVTVTTRFQNQAPKDTLSVTKGPFIEFKMLCKCADKESKICMQHNWFLSALRFYYAMRFAVVVQLCP